MAERRMFAKSIIDSDAFLDMPLSAQALYFHLSMRADDEGFVGNPKKIQRMLGSSDDDLKLLLVKRFILTFDSGIVVIKHWKIHNYLRNDRFKPTTYVEEKSTLKLDSKHAYTECMHAGIPNDNQMTTIGIPNGYQMDTQVSIGKVSIDNRDRQTDYYYYDLNKRTPARTCVWEENKGALLEFKKMIGIVREDIDVEVCSETQQTLCKVLENVVESISNSREMMISGKKVFVFDIIKTFTEALETGLCDELFIKTIKEVSTKTVKGEIENQQNYLISTLYNRIKNGGVL